MFYKDQLKAHNNSQLNQCLMVTIVLKSLLIMKNKKTFGKVNLSYKTVPVMVQ